MRCRRRARVRGSSSRIYIYKAIRAAGCYFYIAAWELPKVGPLTRDQHSPLDPFGFAGVCFFDSPCAYSYVRVYYILWLPLKIYYNILPSFFFFRITSYIHTYITLHTYANAKYYKCAYNKLKHSKIFSLH